MKWSVVMVFMCCAGLAGCVTNYKPGAPDGAVDVIGHRGASAYAPENTLAAFELAKRQGADWFELDCALTQDEEIIVIHDDDLERTTQGTGLIEDHTLAELKKLDAGAWFDPAFAGEPLPTLRESLAMAKGRIGVYVEVKSADDDGELIRALIAAGASHTAMTPELARAMMQLIEDSGTRNLTLTRKVLAEIREKKMARQVVIQSFSPVVCFVALQEGAEFRVEFLGAKSEEDPGRWQTFLDFGNLIGVHGFNVHHESLDAEQLNAFHRAGKTCAVWTVDDQEIMVRMVEWGVDGLITNRPDDCLARLRELQKHP
ncbi:MAG: hypothetical protein HYV27_07525 [Candidatus Hydrogenedentes bacterium]|nr:hypothetical protein [Candidatus Hydrogenedentota bacterium]